MPLADAKTLDIGIEDGPDTHVPVDGSNSCRS